MWSRWAFLFAGLIFFATPVATVAQSSSSPSLLAVCEGDGCSLWEFHGGRATGSFPNGAIANLTIDQFPQSESGTVTIRRVDTSGVGNGIAGTYTGTRKGSTIQGTLSWTWPGHPDGHADWIAVILADTVHMAPAAAHPFSQIPSSLSVCEDGHGCSMWTFNGKTGAIPGLGNLSVERFDDTVVAIRRQEVAGALKGLEALYVGLRRGDKVDGVATWKWSGQPPAGILGWHTTLPSPAAPSEVAKTEPAPAGSSELPPGLPLEKLVDVVKPAAVLKDQPPPPAPWQAKKGVAAFDLNGTWEAQGLPAGQSETISVYQLRDHLVATTIKTTVRGEEHFSPGTLRFRATFTSPNSASGQFEAEDTMDTYTIIDGFDAVITPTSADDFQTSLTLGGTAVMALTTTASQRTGSRMSPAKSRILITSSATRRSSEETFIFSKTIPSPPTAGFILQRPKAIAMPARNTEDPFTTGVAFRPTCRSASAGSSRRRWTVVCVRVVICRSSSPGVVFLQASSGTTTGWLAILAPIRW